MSKSTTYDRLSKDQRAKLRNLCLQVQCPYCRMDPGEMCRGVAGKLAKPHYDRRRSFSKQVLNGPDFHITTPNKMASNISETDITRNGEQMVLNRLFRCETKVYTNEAIAHRLDSLETLVRVILDRLSEVDGKRIKEENAPFGYDIILVKKEH